MVRGRPADPAGARRSLDVRRRPASTAAAVPPSARDGRRGRPLGLPGRPVGKAAADQLLPRGDLVRHGSRTRSGQSATCGRSTNGSRVRPRTAGRIAPPTHTCCAGCTWPRSTASSTPTSGSRAHHSTEPVATGTSPTPPRWRGLWGSTNPPTSEAELKEQLSDYRPELRSTPEAREAARYLLLRPPVPWFARPPVAVLQAAAVALLPSWARRPLRLPFVPVTEATVVQASGRTLVRTLGWVMGHRR